MSDSPSGTFGGLLSGLFGGRTNDDGSRASGSTSGKLVKGALLAAGAAYLYKRYKAGNLNVPGIAPKQ
ncbi:hypothetical protein MON38_08790 [Hymenobacter sp. DH14]|uniref:Uncharacterized protein n=1 Tax=Hymenobacter cyanobacteriorum TaxID=2926463 RepID=A0A9X1VFA3_9BACT|nr:hypothetical protein [Hymenobacter cyanobacteriorum]MCI1187515.1 hypothetical protein [Hymenobacter cyanobacteriorum]